MKVLCCGGHADGRWMEVDADAKYLEIAAPGTFRWKSPEKVETEKQVYRIWPVTILGYGMHIAVLDTHNHESDVALRAIVQRDVADHLRGSQR